MILVHSCFPSIIIVGVDLLLPSSSSSLGRRHSNQKHSFNFAGAGCFALALPIKLAAESNQIELTFTFALITVVEILVFFRCFHIARIRPVLVRKANQSFLLRSFFTGQNSIAKTFDVSRHSHFLTHFIVDLHIRQKRRAD